MLKQIFEMLPYAPIGESDKIDRAKGKYKFPETFKELKKYTKWRLLKR